jgi:hypothetical protein
MLFRLLVYSLFLFAVGTINYRLMLGCGHEVTIRGFGTRNKIGKVCFLDNIDITKVFFMPHHTGRCCTYVIRGQFFVSGHSCTLAIQGRSCVFGHSLTNAVACHCYASSNSDLRSILH